MTGCVVRDRFGGVVRSFWVYILASRPGGTLYIGVTSDLDCRVQEHKQKLVPGFTEKYAIDRLVHYESFPDARSAFAREKQLKGWRRSKKTNLIAAANPQWDDLYDEADQTVVPLPELE
ncbi:MAG: GIY-YIG nuclease family protein [Planctomycetota bacterium]